MGVELRDLFWEGERRNDGGRPRAPQPGEPTRGAGGGERAHGLGLHVPIALSFIAEMGIGEASDPVTFIGRPVLSCIDASGIYRLFLDEEIMGYQKAAAAAYIQKLSPGFDVPNVPPCSIPNRQS